MWPQLTSNVVLVQKLSKFLKLVKIAIVMVVSNVEDEKIFPTISFHEVQAPQSFDHTLELGDLDVYTKVL
jgi:hypothetical protein